MTLSSYAYVALIVTSIISGAVAYHYKEVSNLNAEVTKLHKKNSNLLLNYEKSKEELEKQNTKIKELSAGMLQQMEELKKWKSKKPEIRYEKIYKIREVKSDDCEDVKSTLDAIRNLEYREL